MKLDELEIRDARAGVERERDPVAGRDRGVRGLAKHLTRAAGRQEYGARVHLAAHAARVEVAKAARVPAVDDQVRDECVIDGLDRRERAHSLPQHASNLAAGGVAARGGRGERCARPRGRAPDGRRPRGGIERPTPAARARTAGRPGPANRPPPRRTVRRRRGACLPHVTTACRRRPRPPRCRPARNRCCSQPVQPWSARARGPRPPDRSPLAVRPRRRPR